MRKILLLFMALISFQGLFGQAGQLDPSFNPIPDIPAFLSGELATGSVTKYVKQTDGKIIAIGTFSGAIKRFNADGSVDQSFIGPSITGGFIKDISLFFNDQAMVVGNMVTSNTGNHYLALLNINGTIDTNFPKYVPAGNIDHVSTNANGSLVMIAGGFSDLSINNGAFQPRLRFAIIGINGTLFSNNPGIDGAVNQVIKDAQGRHVFVGDFTTFNGQSYPRMFRLDNNFNLDATFTVGSGFTGAAYAVTQQADGKYIVGGDMTAYEGNATNRLVRLNEDGTYDASFTPSTFDNRILAVAASAEGKVFAGGSFINYNGINQYRLVGLNADGSLNPAFSVGTALNGSVNALLAMDGERLLVAGAFDNFKGATRRNPLLLNKYGNRITNNEAGVANGTIVRTAEQADGKIIIAGNFTAVRGVPRNGIARLNADGTLDLSFDPGAGFNNTVDAIGIQSDDKIILGGSFTTFNGLAQLRLVRLNADGTKDDTFVPVGLNNGVGDIKIDANGKIYIAGGFGLTGGNGFARLNADGSQDSNFSTPGGANNGVARIHLYDDGKILLCGLFSAFNGNTTVGKLVRLNADGTVDTSLSTSVGGVGFDTYSVSTMHVQADGKIIVGGNWPYYQRSGVLTYSKALMRLNVDGSFDGSFLYNNGFNTNASVSDIVVHPTGQIAVSGNIANYGATNVNHFAYFESDGTFIPSAVQGTNFSTSVSDLVLLNNGKLLVSGGFANYNGAAHNGIVQLENPCSESTQQSASICQGDEYTFGSQTLTAAGVFTEVFSNQFSCDSTVTLTLSVIPTQFAMTMERCEFETLVVNGQSINSYGDFEFIIPRAGTCDSVLTVTVAPKELPEELVVDASICEGETYVYSVMAWNENNEFVAFNSDTLTTDGVYNFSLRLGENGCETNVTVNLNVNPVYNIETEDTFCPGEGFVFGDETLTQAGVYTKLFTSAFGCDSTVVLTLNPLTAELAYDEVNQRITASTDFTNYRLYKNDNLVASGASGTIEYPVTECGDYQAIFGGEVPACNMGINITKSGANCQAAINVAVSNATLPLQVNVSFTGNSTGNNSVQNNLNFSFAGACPSVYTIRVTDALGCQKSLTIDYNTSDLFWQLLPVSASCEVYSQVLHVNFQQVDSIELSICDGEVFTFGEQNLTEAGVYESLFTSSRGCDSTAILTLSVTPNPLTDLVYNAETKRISASNANYDSYKLFRDDVVVSSSAISSTIDYLAEDCGEYRAEFGTVSCNISISGNRTGFNQCAYSWNINVSNVEFPIKWNVSTYFFNSFFNSTTLEQELEGTSSSNSFTVSNACFRTYSRIRIEDANGCTQFIQVDNSNAGSFSIDGGQPNLPTCTPVTNVVSIERPQTTESSLELCADETYQFGEQLISAEGIYTEVFNTNNCDSTVVLTVTVFDNLSIVTQPQSATLCESSSVTLSIEAIGKDLTYLWYKNGSDISGATNSSILLENLTSNDAAEYSVLVTDGCGNSQLSEIATLGVSAPPTINQQPNSLVVCEGAEASFSIEVAGENAANFQWKKDGVNIDGATGTTFTISEVTLADMGNYSVEFTEDCGLASSSVATLAVNSSPLITQQPNGFTICEGDNAASMEVVSTGSELSYQWFFMGDTIVGATNNTLAFESFITENSGDYLVKVSGICGEILSSQVANIEVQSLISIQQNPASVAVCLGADASFSALASGSGTLSYQWKKDNVNIDGATDASLTVSSVSAAELGAYTVEVTGACGTAESTIANLTIAEQTAIINQPASITVCEAGTGMLQVSASGNNLNYHWSKNGEAIEGATESFYAFEGISSANAGDYTVTVTGTCGTIVSQTATVTVNPITQIVNQPVGLTVCPTEAINLSVSASGTGTLTYQWKNNGEIIAGANQSTYSIASASSNHAGQYSVEVSGDCGSVTSAAVQVLVNETTQITQQPQSVTICAGENASFTVAAIGTNLNYEWFKNETSVGNSSTLQFINVSTAQSGNYVAVVSGECGVSTSLTVSLTVNIAENVEQTEVACENFTLNDVTYTESGQYVQNLSDDNGCTYALTLNLTIINLNNELTLNGTVLTATQEDATYQWYDCTNDIIIEGATGRSFEATVSGNYQVEVIQNGCSKLSECIEVNVLGLADGLSHEMSYYPNPVENSLNVRFTESQSKGQVYLMTTDGKIISTQGFEGTELQIDTEALKSGIYFLRIQNEKGTSLMKIMKR